MSIPQHIKFTEKLGESNGSTMFIITEKQQESILNFSSDYLNVLKQYKQWDILNILNRGSSSKFVSRKGNIVNDQSNASYDDGNESVEI